MKKNLGFLLLFGGFVWLFILTPLSQRPMQRGVILKQFDRMGAKETFTRDEIRAAIRETSDDMVERCFKTQWAAIAMLIGGFLVAEAKRRSAE